MIVGARLWILERDVLACGVWIAVFAIRLRTYYHVLSWIESRPDVTAPPRRRRNDRRHRLVERYAIALSAISTMASTGSIANTKGT